IALWLLGVLVTLGAVLWLAGELSARVTSGAWPQVSVSEMGPVVAALPRHAGDPAEAWPSTARPLMPGPVGFYTVFGVVLLLTAGALVLIMRRVGVRSTARGAARWAHAQDLRSLRIRRREPGRLILGRASGRLIAAEPRQSAIVVGPTQTGKTTGFAIPAILEWQGPVAATSAKTDLLRETIDSRSAIREAKTFIYNPTNNTALPRAALAPLPSSLT